MKIPFLEAVEGDKGYQYTRPRIDMNYLDRQQKWGLRVIRKYLKGETDYPPEPHAKRYTRP
jgi:hypothetical protein